MVRVIYGVFSLVGLLAALAITFMLGMRWQVFEITTNLKQSGSAVARWGDTSRVKIVGTAQDIK